MASTPKGMDGAFKNVNQSPVVTEVPDHILDAVADFAEEYVRPEAQGGSRERWLAMGDNPDGTLDQQGRDFIATNATVNNLRTPERRDLHRAILHETACSLIGQRSEKPKCLYIFGPPAVGKSKLQKFFDQRMGKEQAGEQVAPYAGFQLEYLYQTYKACKEYSLASDFQLFKDRLPEYAAHGNYFALIRPEASGLDQAVREWAKELGANNIIEMFPGFPDDGPWFDGMVQHYELTALGISGGLGHNLNGLRKRNADTGQIIDEIEWARAASDLSYESFLSDLEARSHRFIVLNSSEQGYALVTDWMHGVERYTDQAAYDSIKLRGNQKPDQILEIAKHEAEQLVAKPGTPGLEAT